MTMEYWRAAGKDPTGMGSRPRIGAAATTSSWSGSVETPTQSSTDSAGCSLEWCAQVSPQTIGVIISLFPVKAKPFALTWTLIGVVINQTGWTFFTLEFWKMDGDNFSPSKP